MLTIVKTLIRVNQRVVCENNFFLKFDSTTDRFYSNCNENTKVDVLT